MSEPEDSLPHVTPAMMLYWLSRLLMAFGVASGLLIAGFAPYSAAMGELLAVAGGLLAGGVAIGMLGGLLQRWLGLPD